MAADEPKPLDGKTTVDEKVVFEAQRLSYDAASTLAERIARRISERTRGKLVIVAGVQLLSDMSNLVATRSILMEIAKDYEAIASAAHPATTAVIRSAIFAQLDAAVKATLIPALGTVTTVVQGALTLASLFRQDVDYKGIPVSIDTLAFELELASRIRMHKAQSVIVPDFAVFAEPQTGANALSTLLAKAKSARLDALRATAMAKRHAPASTPAGKNPTPHKPGAPPPADDVGTPANASDADVAALAAALAQVDQRLNDVQAQLAKGDADGSGLTMLARLLRVETITAAPYTLVHARVVLAGGSNRVQHSLWSSIVSGDGLSSSGGAVVSWAILNANGAVEDGGVFSHSMNAKSPKPPEARPSIT